MNDTPTVAGGKRGNGTAETNGAYVIEPKAGAFGQLWEEAVFGEHRDPAPTPDRLSAEGGASSPGQAATELGAQAIASSAFDRAGDDAADGLAELPVPDDGAYDLSRAVVCALKATPRVLRELLASAEGESRNVVFLPDELALAGALGEAAYWRETATRERAKFAEYAAAMEHRYNQVRGQQGNEIGRLRAELAHCHAEQSAPAYPEDSPRAALDARLRAVIEWVSRQDHRRAIELDDVVHQLDVLVTASARPSQAAVGAWLAKAFGPDRSPVQQALVLAEEVGEVCRAVVKRDQGIRGTRAEWAAELRKELADVQLVLLALADCERIDLDAATAERWAEVTRRDPSARRAPGAPASDTTEGAA